MMRATISICLFSSLALFAALGCSDDAAVGASWDVREQGDVRDVGADGDTSADDASDARDPSDFTFQAIPLATALDRLVFAAHHKSLGYCIEMVMASPSDWYQWENVERPEGWTIEALAASGSGCSPDPWPSGEGLAPTEASGVISMSQTDVPYNGTISVELSLRFPANEEGIPRRVEFESGEVEFGCCG